MICLTAIFQSIVFLAKQGLPVLVMYSMKECNAASITYTITDVMLRCDFDVQNWKGQTYDGA